MIDLLNTIGEQWVAYFTLHILQNTLFLILFFLMLFILRKADAGTKYLIALIGMLKLLIPGFIPMTFFFWNSTPSSAIPVPVNEITIISPAVPYKPVLSLNAIGLVVWIGIIAVILLCYFVSSLRLYLIIKNSEGVSNEKFKGIKIFKSNKLSTPMTTILRPKWKIPGISDTHSGRFRTRIPA